MSSTDSTVNIINQPGVFYPLLLILITLITFILLFVYKKDFVTKALSISMINGQQSVEASVKDTILILFSVFFIVAFIFLLVPNFAAVKQILLELKTMSAVMIYTAVLVLLLTQLPTSYFEEYSYIFTPTAIIMGLFLLGNSYADGFEKTGFKEDIRSLVLFTSFIAMAGTFYSVNPGGFNDKINTNVWYQIIVALVGFLGLLYTVVGLAVFKPSSQTTKTNTNYFVKPGLVLLFAFVTSLVYGIKGHKNILEDGVSSSGVGLLTLLTVFVWSILFSSGISERIQNLDEIKEYKGALLKLFGSGLVLIIVTWFIKNIGNAPVMTSIIKNSFSLILGVAVIALLYKGFAKTGIQSKVQDSSLFQSFKSELEGTDTNSLLALITILVVIFGYFLSPIIYNKVSLRGGQTFITQPINLNDKVTLATYEQLNGPIDIGNDAAKELEIYNNRKIKQRSVFNYTYGLSFWVYIDSSSPNTNQSYSKYTSILNYGGKPNILYKASTNTLLVTFNAPNDLDLDSLNGASDVIVYKNNNFLLQKWNHFVINYNGSNLDIFLNGELVKSNIKAVPQMKLDSLVVGTDNGIYGGLCNLVYFQKQLSITQIYYIYNMLKDKNPPVL
jgi:hypothetical protein